MLYFGLASLYVLFTNFCFCPCLWCVTSHSAVPYSYYWSVRPWDKTLLLAEKQHSEFFSEVTEVTLLTSRNFIESPYIYIF